MIDHNKEEMYHCDSICSDISFKEYIDLSKSNLVTPLAIIYRDPNQDDEEFYIPNFNTGLGYCISMYRPEYTRKDSPRLSKSDKEVLMKALLNGGWEKLIESFNRGCDDLCSDDGKCNYCEHRKHRHKFPDTPPDYTKLPE